MDQQKTVAVTDRAEDAESHGTRSHGDRLSSAWTYHGVPVRSVASGTLLRRRCDAQVVLNSTDLPIPRNRATGRVGSGMVESMSADDCIFCRVVAGTVESSRVYEDDEVLAFMDIQPVTDGHLLVIPKRHAPYLADLDAQLGMSMFRVGQRLAAALRTSGLPCEGVNLFLADGEAAFQEIFHVHLHVFPRIPGDGFRIEADWRQRPRAELDNAAERIQNSMASSPS